MEVLVAGAAHFLNNITSQKLLSGLGLAWLAVNGGTDSARWSDLAARLSPGAHIIEPADTRFLNATHRWTDWKAPGVGVVVRTSTEQDVQETVRQGMVLLVPIWRAD
jgi:hypothetical protein